MPIYKFNAAPDPTTWEVVLRDVGLSLLRNHSMAAKNRRVEGAEDILGA